MSHPVHPAGASHHGRQELKSLPAIRSGRVPCDRSLPEPSLSDPAADFCYPFCHPWWLLPSALQIYFQEDSEASRRILRPCGGPNNLDQYVGPGLGWRCLGNGGWVSRIPVILLSPFSPQMTGLGGVIMNNCCQLGIPVQAPYTLRLQLPHPTHTVGIGTPSLFPVLEFSLTIKPLLGALETWEPSKRSCLHSQSCVVSMVLGSKTFMETDL